MTSWRRKGPLSWFIERRCGIVRYVVKVFYMPGGCQWLYHIERWEGKHRDLNYMNFVMPLDIPNKRHCGRAKTAAWNSLMNDIRYRQDKKGQE